MATVLVQTRVDAELKAAVDKIFAREGLDTPTAVRMFLTRTKNTESFPYEISRNEDIERINREARTEADEILAHPERYKSYKNVREMMDEILSEGYTNEKEA